MSEDARRPALAVFAGLATALVSLALAGLTGAPYLGTDDLNGWLIVFAVGVFAALFAVPFWIERRQRARRPDSEQRWEQALVAWGGVALLAGALGLLVGLGGDFAGDSLAGSAGLVVVIEAALVLGTLLVWMLVG